MVLDFKKKLSGNFKKCFKFSWVYFTAQYFKVSKALFHKFLKIQRHLISQYDPISSHNELCRSFLQLHINIKFNRNIYSKLSIFCFNPSPHESLIPISVISCLLDLTPTHCIILPSQVLSHYICLSEYDFSLQDSPLTSC